MILYTCDRCGKTGGTILFQTSVDEMFFGTDDHYLCKECHDELLISDERNREEAPHNNEFVEDSENDGIE